MSETSSAVINKTDQECLSGIRDKFLAYPLGQGFSPSDVPWRRNKRGYDAGVVGLHNEIKDFFDFIKPTNEDQYVRELVVSRIRDVAMAMWPNCRVDVFGSFKTGLYLPTSDIDMVIFGKWETLPLHTLKKALSKTGLSSEITVLDRATVPIVKMTDRETGLRVDISFNMINSVRAAELIRCYMQTYPPLPYLVFVLKQFLLQRRLNEVWTGGLSSYALILMVVRFLQEKISPNWSLEDANLGVLLLEFFELYGRLFNYGKTAIRVVDGGEYVRKEVVLQNMVNSARPSILCIEDPLCPGNDVGRRSYQILLIKQAFEHAYVVLSSAVLPQYCFLHGHKDESILGLVIRVSETTLECRQRIRDYGMRLLSCLRQQHSADGFQHPMTWSIPTRLPYPLFGMNYPILPPQAMMPFPPPNISSIPPPGLAWSVANGPPPRLILQMAPTVQQPEATAVDPPTTRTSPPSDVESSNTESSSTQSTVLESRADNASKPAKPSEDSVLAEDFASLSTLLRADSQSDPTSSDATDNHRPQPAANEDCKRRCLRSISPPQQSNDTERGDKSDRNTNAHRSFNQSKNSRGRKSSSKAARSQTMTHSPLRNNTPIMPDSHYFRFVNPAPSTAVPCGQKRHAPGSRRFK